MGYFCATARRGGLFRFAQFWLGFSWYGERDSVPTHQRTGRSENSINPRSILEESALKDETTAGGFKKVPRSELIELLNQDLSREYQAIIGYVVYSQVLKGAEFMNIAGELEKHAAQELSHALIIAKQIDYLGGMPAVEAKTVRTSEKATEMLQFDLENETETIRNYRERVRQCEELAEYAMGEQIREILIDEQDHQIALATALGKSVPIQRKTA
jgi:bacterioferritin